MTDKEVKLAIQSAIKSFAAGNLTDQAISLFKRIGYNTERQNPFTQKNFAFFKDSFLGGDSRFNEEKALVKEWKSVDLLFQLTRDEVSDQKSLFDTKKVDNTIIETYLFFALELTKFEYTRTALAQITREINKVFPMPVMLLFKNGDYLTLSVINRRLNKKDEQKDVLEKVTLIKDISIANPHRAHIEILFDLSFSELLRIHKVTNFVELHNAWRKTLDTKELNKRFYRELSNWYFWAIHEVAFPGTEMEADKTGIFQQEDKVREHNAKNLIRLLTRILFIWFIKEKNLIPDELFDEAYIRDNLINGFEPRKKKGFDHKTQGSKYYRAILQNLFFATLNQTVGKREFRKEGQQMNVTNLMRYESYFKNPKAFIKVVEEVVPFMNGGLFECMDSPDPVLKGKKGGDIIIYEDGFSDRKDNILCVPDYIFFGTGEHADLSEELGDKKQKDVMVSGLINILKSYKFTVTENTPIEEDIALDPELLGRVFENLLASYNPETKTTARKQTGSFYTPREIVNYMVDESLKAYLKQTLETEAGMKPEDAETGLEFLIGYNEKEHLFDEKQTSTLIEAIDNCNILDPACGSGAFPMGILHKLVHILHKLDPKNEKWKERQIEKARQIDDPGIRDQLITDIESAFENNELDYGRKLYLVENCIYGVDIQPIATQISKLRFFISLIVDQNTDNTRDNFGIRPLPNLETKFVAANTLIGIEKPKVQGSLFDNTKVKELEEKLKDVRHRLFSAKTPAAKRKLREEDQNLRDQMGKILEDSGWSNESARQLAAWDPYNQNASSPFFDAEWMFGLIDGFDVVIGNPPYLESRHPSFSDHLKTSYQKNCKRRWGSDAYLITRGSDLLIYFFEVSISLINKLGNIVLITQNAWLDTEYGIAAQNFLTKHTNVLRVIDSKYRYFPAGEGPNINTVITIFKGKEKNPQNLVRFYILKENIETISLDWSIKENTDNDKYKLNIFSYSDNFITKYKWGILHNSDSFILNIINVLEQKATTIDKIPAKSNFSFGQGLNLSKTHFVPLEIISKHAIELNNCFPILYTGTPFKIKHSDWYLVRKNKIEKSIAEKLHVDGYDAFDENTTRKKPPVLIMPRGISKHFCSLNYISAYSLSGVDVYATDKINIDIEVLNLWCFFNSSIFWLLREISGRKNLGGGLLKSEATDLCSFPVYLPLNLNEEIFAPLFDRDAKDTLSEILSEEHKLIDKIIFDYLAFSEKDRQRCCEYLRTAIEFRNRRSVT